MKKGLIVGLMLGLISLLIGGVWWQKQTNQPVWREEEGEEEEVEPATGSAGKLEFEVKQPASGEISPEAQAGELGEEMKQLEQEIDQLLNDLNLEEEPEIDFRI